MSLFLTDPDYIKSISRWFNLSCLFLVIYTQDKRKHRGPCNKITPKSREFIETDSSSSSSECQSDSEEAMKIPALPPLSSCSVINTQTLSNAHMHTPLLPCLGSASSLGPCTGKGLRVKDSSSIITNTNSSSSNSSSSSCSNGNSSSSNTLSITNVTGSFGTSVPDPGGSGTQCKERESVSPPDNMRIDLPLSPLREYQEIQSLWVKIDLSLLSRVPGQGLGEISQVGIKDRDESDGRDRERHSERERVVGGRDRQKQEDRDWSGLRERQKLPKGERQEEETERLVQDRERQGDRGRLIERERQADREERERPGLDQRDRMTERRETVCQGLGVLDNPPVQDKSNPRLLGRTARGEGGGKHRRQTAGNMLGPAEKYTIKSKRKHKVWSPNFTLWILCFFLLLSDVCVLCISSRTTTTRPSTAIRSCDWTKTVSSSHPASPQYTITRTAAQSKCSQWAHCYHRTGSHAPNVLGKVGDKGITLI